MEPRTCPSTMPRTTSGPGRVADRTRARRRGEPVGERPTRRHGHSQGRRAPETRPIRALRPVGASMADHMATSARPRPPLTAADSRPSPPTGHDRTSERPPRPRGRATKLAQRSLRADLVESGPPHELDPAHRRPSHHSAASRTPGRTRSPAARPSTHRPPFRARPCRAVEGAGRLEGDRPPRKSAASAGVSRLEALPGPEPTPDDRRPLESGIRCGNRWRSDHRVYCRRAPLEGYRSVQHGQQIGSDR